MMNEIEHAVVLQESLDQQCISEAATGFMEENGKDIIYLGGNKIKIPKLSLSGLGAYNRKEGKFPKGKIRLTWREVSLTQDRGAEFYFDRNDVDESNYILEATRVLSEFQRTKVIPEVDAYRISTIAKLLIHKKMQVKENLTKENFIGNFFKQFRKAQDACGLQERDFVCLLSFQTYEYLTLNEHASRILFLKNFQQGEQHYDLQFLGDIPLIPVRSNCMKTDYIFENGETQSGFTPTKDAALIQYLIIPKRAVSAISKTDTLKIFSPDTNQEGDGWKTQYRKYHDVFINEEYLSGFVLSVGA